MSEYRSYSPLEHRRTLEIKRPSEQEFLSLPTDIQQQVIGTALYNMDHAPRLSSPRVNVSDLLK